MPGRRRDVVPTASDDPRGAGLATVATYANSAAVGALALAVSATVTGLAAVLGAGGIGLAVLLLMFFGNPFSGIASAPELLPQPSGAIGQWLPPGAGGTLLRSVAFFDGAASATPWAVLAAWTIGGLGLVVLGAATRHQHRAPLDVDHGEVVGTRTK